MCEAPAEAPAEVEAPPTVAELLRRSRAANEARIRAGNSKPPAYKIAEQHAAQALALREQADQLDPEHADPEWAKDKAPHAEVMAFLMKYPTIP